MTDEDLQATYRILDASANRAGEGLRTIEEFARFVLEDSQMTAQLKSLRHDLAAAVNRLSRDSLLRARDTGGDVGTEIGEPSEYTRTDLSVVVAAAASRTQQSLRVLEEYGKTVDASVAAEIEQIRYRCYTLCAEIELRLQPLDRLHPLDRLGHDRQLRLRQSSLYVLIDAGSDEQEFTDLVTRLVQVGVDVLQLRDRSVDDRTLLSRARLGAEITRESDKLFIINDRADLAVAADTDGVHVGQEELPVAETRQIVGPSRLVGVSTHSIGQARDAVADGADYIGCGPVFAGRTKAFRSYVGTSFLKEVAGEIEIPAFAIGGIDASNTKQVVEAGFHRIAVTGAVRDADDPAAAVTALKNILLPY
jgi:thiamine-phosphate pyrophosphorylase